jgi:hypothetical protein
MSTGDQDWEELILSAPSPRHVAMDGRWAGAIAHAKIVRRAQCRPCRLMVEISSEGLVRVTGTSDEALHADVMRAVQGVVSQHMSADAVLNIEWPWPIRAEDVVVKIKAF